MVFKLEESSSSPYHDFKETSLDGSNPCGNFQVRGENCTGDKKVRDNCFSLDPKLKVVYTKSVRR